MLLLAAAPEALAMRKPLDGLRDYNGTHEGTPATGWRAYNTLHRDNYAGESGCRGEGCGKHPGVDIDGTSGEPVYAVLSGTLVRSECSTSWGGLIVIRSANPYKSGEYIYHSYAHLRARSFSSADEGSWIAEGRVIGRVGGAYGDPCRGRSTGAHLHFQIDKDHAAGKPWFPQPVERVGHADTDFEVARYTYNPIPFVTGHYLWSFEQDGFSEHWVPNYRSGVRNGYLWMDGDYDPFIARANPVDCSQGRCSGEIAAEADIYRYVEIGLDTWCVDNPGRVYFTTDRDDTWNDAKMGEFYYNGPGTYTVPIYTIPAWQGIIRRLRIDPAQNCDPFKTEPTFFHYVRIKDVSW